MVIPDIASVKRKPVPIVKPISIGFISDLFFDLILLSLPSMSELYST
jgi:hypothetical protein